ncbi:X-linked lymphocyte-regulated protein 3A-like protein, partial [Cricetulus griseus]
RHCLFAPAQQVPGHIATACGVLVPVSVAAMKFFSVSLLCTPSFQESCPAQRSPARPQAMSTKDQKDMERRAKRPRVDQNLPSDDSQNPDAITPAKDPAVDTSEMGSCSSGSDVQEARKPVQKRIQDFKGGFEHKLLVPELSFRPHNLCVRNCCLGSEVSRKWWHYPVPSGEEEAVWKGYKCLFQKPERKPPEYFQNPEEVT